MQPAHIDRPLQREPRLLDESARRAEEQLAFHERYHNRMSQLLDGDVRRTEPVSCTPFREPTQNYWADYERKLEEMGVVRNDTHAMPPPPPPAPSSSSCAPAEASSVLGRLDWLARERDEPDAADVIELLREVEDVLEREKDTARPATSAPDIFRQPPPATARTAAPEMGYPQMQSLQQQQQQPQHQLQHEKMQQESFRQAVPDSSSAIGNGRGGAPFAQPADWSRMPSSQQMEWYRVYYAWMVYYAQYYGAALATQQQQQQQQVQGRPQDKSKSTAQTYSREAKTRADIRKLNQEYSELAADVEDLKEKSRQYRNPNPSSRASSLRPVRREHRATQRRPSLTPREQKETDAHYGPAHRHSQQRRAPQRVLKDSSRERPRISGVGRFDPPWLPPQSHEESDEERGEVWYDEEDKEGRNAWPHSRHSQPAERDIAWLYRYEEEEGEEEDGHSYAGAETGTQEGRDERFSDGHIKNVITRRGQDLKPDKNRLSVYERRRQELKNEKPRWCF